MTELAVLGVFPLWFAVGFAVLMAVSSSEFEDRGYRTVEAGEYSPAGESRVSERARRSSPADWNEDLGPVFGSEEWELPGMGESGPRCGEWVPEAVCGTCGHLDLVKDSCERRTCPECWGIWAKDAAVRATVRIQSFRHTMPSNFMRQVARGVVSPPEGEITNEEEFVAGRKKAAEIAEGRGWRGFLIISHPFRATDEGKERYESDVPRDSDGNAVYGFWVWWRNDAGQLEELIEWSPHYHIIGMTGRDMDPAEKRGDGWTYNFFGSMPSYEGMRDTESHEAVYGHIRYLLSHTGWPEGWTGQAVVWYGCLSNSTFVEDATQEWQYEKPSEWIRETIRESVEEIAGPVEDDERDESGAEIRDEGKCPCDGCDGRLIHVFDLDRYVREFNPPPDVRDRMIAAREWRLGRTGPPAGMKHPQSEEDAREAFTAILER